jgi:hypothetical protein
MRTSGYFKRLVDFLWSNWKTSILLAGVGILFWVSAGFISQQVLSQSHATNSPLQVVKQHQVQLSLSLTLVSIDVEIDQSSQSSEVSVRVMGSPLEEMEFKFPIAEFSAVERAIAQELGLPIADIQNLIRYRIQS